MASGMPSPRRRCRVCLNTLTGPLMSNGFMETAAADYPLKNYLVPLHWLASRSCLQGAPLLRRKLDLVRTMLVGSIGRPLDAAARVEPGRCGRQSGLNGSQACTGLETEVLQNAAEPHVGGCVATVRAGAMSDAMTIDDGRASAEGANGPPNEQPRRSGQETELDCKAMESEERVAETDTLT